MRSKYKTLELNFNNADQERVFAFCRKVANAVKSANGEVENVSLALREKIQKLFVPTATNEELELAFTKSVLLDLACAGWKIKVEKGKVRIASPVSSENDIEALKETVRKSHLLERNEQLRQPSVRDFIQSMERRRLTKQGWHSIFSVMRDGQQLASALRDASSFTEREEKLNQLGQVIDPYIELVTEKGVCKQTGLLLRDIWRYFRHTWINSYKTLPGRTMSLLIRDAAAPNHPVIGIAALGSAVAQQRIRDEWLGWDQKTMIETIRKDPCQKYAKWLLESLQAQIDNIYIEDFVFDGTFQREELKKPSVELIEKLEERGEAEIKLHQIHPGAASHKASQASGNDADWELQAQTHLFRSKRCKTLAKLMKILNEFHDSGLHMGTSEELKKAIENIKMRNAVGLLVRLVKAQHVGIDMMDIIVCGAVAPYNKLLGGKLVCMLLGSPEVVEIYRKRYSEQVSVIASSMKGAKVVRPPQLVFLGTTSLYGVGSSQYNRVQIPCKEVDGKPGEKVRYFNLGKSEGYGSYHFSDFSVRACDLRLGRRIEGRRVNSIFGEGVNPRMRKLREAFELVGLPSDDILNHRNPRIVYGIKLAENTPEVLLGLNKKARYLIPLKDAKQKTKLVSAYWRKRWLEGRIGRAGILDAVAEHTLAYPVTHGGRVDLPMIESDQDDLDFD